MADHLSSSTLILKESLARKWRTSNEDHQGLRQKPPAADLLRPCARHLMGRHPLRGPGDTRRPSVAGILLTGLLYGRAGLHDLLTRMRRWRVGARWYALALLTAPLLFTAVLF